MTTRAGMAAIDAYDLNPRPRGNIGRRRLSARALGTNPRALGTNPRALGTNPTAGTARDTERVRRTIARAHDVIHAAGRVICERCADWHEVEGAPCGCRPLTTREASRLSRLTASAIASSTASQIVGATVDSIISHH